MTVAELIAELEKIEDKQKYVMVYDYYGDDMMAQSVTPYGADSVLLE